MNINLKSTTVILLLTSILVTLVSGLGTYLTPIKPFFFSEYLTGMPEILAGQVWRLFTPMFLHFGLTHIALNGLVLWQLGNLLEKHHSTMTYILLILTTSLTSNFAQYLVSGPLFGGMSGVLYGLFGYIWIRGWREPDVPYKQPKIFIIITLVGLGLCWTGLLGNIANTAHIVGLLTGMIWAYFATSASMRRADYNYRHSDL